MNSRIIVILSFLIMLSANAIHADNCNIRCCDEEFPRLTVQGEGKIETLADKATFKISLRAEEKKLDRAFEKSTEKINSISGVLSSFMVKKTDIQNLGYTYHPLYEGKQIFSSVARPTSYEVLYTLKVTVTNLEKLGNILTELSDIPETSVQGLTYTSTRIEDLKRDVLKLAASDAKAKATKLAEGAGAVLGKVVRINTATSQYINAPQQSYAERADFSVMAVKTMQAPQLESGSLEITGQCEVVYQIQ